MTVASVHKRPLLALATALIIVSTNRNGGTLIPVCMAENPLSHIGMPSLDILQYSYDTKIEQDNDSGTCTYALTMNFNHEESFPFGELGSTCEVDVIAPDGLPYLAHRWYYTRFDYATQLATGFVHASMDWNACGHPGFGFSTPHYDLHVYTVTPEFRATNMQCDKVFGTPTCKPANEQTGSGKGYYVFGQVAGTRQLDNLPAGYIWDQRSAVEYMGTHAGHPDFEPQHFLNWTDPVLYFTNFNGAVISVEPMLPFEFCSGDKDNFREETVEYEVKTLVTLPEYWSVAYKKATGFTTVTFKGPSALCPEDFEEARKNGPPGLGDGSNPPGQSSSATRRSVRASLALLMAVISGTIMSGTWRY